MRQMLTMHMVDSREELLDQLVSHLFPLIRVLVLLVIVIFILVVLVISINFLLNRPIFIKILHDKI